MRNLHVSASREMYNDLIFIFEGKRWSGPIRKGHRHWITKNQDLVQVHSTTPNGVRYIRERAKHNTTPNRQNSEERRREGGIFSDLIHFLGIFSAFSHGVPAIYRLPSHCDSSPSDPRLPLLLPPRRQSSGLSEGQFPPSFRVSVLCFLLDLCEFYVRSRGLRLASEKKEEQWTALLFEFCVWCCFGLCGRKKADQLNWCVSFSDIPVLSWQPNGELRWK